MKVILKFIVVFCFLGGSFFFSLHFAPSAHASQISDYIGALGDEPQKTGCLNCLRDHGCDGKEGGDWGSCIDGCAQDSVSVGEDGSGKFCVQSQVDALKSDPPAPPATPLTLSPDCKNCLDACDDGMADQTDLDVCHSACVSDKKACKEDEHNLYDATPRSGRSCEECLKAARMSPVGTRGDTYEKCKKKFGTDKEPCTIFPDFKPHLTLVAGGFGCSEGDRAANDGTCPSVGVDALVRLFAKTFSFIIGGVAVLKIILGGYLYATAAGNSTQMANGKNHILYAFIGIALIVFANIILTLFGLYNI